jgi:hypothetical protein
MLDCVGVVNDGEAVLAGLATELVNTEVASVLGLEIELVLESRHDAPEHKPSNRPRDRPILTRDGIPFC